MAQREQVLDAMKSQNFNQSDQPQYANFGQNNNQSAISMSPQSQLQIEIQRNHDQLMNYRNQLVEFVNNKYYPDLRIEVVSSATLNKGQLITINPLGLSGEEQSLRIMSQNHLKNKAAQSYNTAPDGFTYFGSQAEMFEGEMNVDDEDLMPTQDHGNQRNDLIVVNDFVIPSRNQ